MNIQQAIELFRSGKLDEIEIRRNPADIRQWFVMARQFNGKLLILVDENDSPVVNNDLEELFTVLKKIGFREVRVFF